MRIASSHTTYTSLQVSLLPFVARPGETTYLGTNQLASKISAATEAEFRPDDAFMRLLCPRKSAHGLLVHASEILHILLLRYPTYLFPAVRHLPASGLSKSRDNR